MELVSLSCEVPQPVKLSWSAELYHGEFDDLSKCSLYSNEPILPRLREDNLGISSVSHTNQPTSEILQVCGICFQEKSSVKIILQGLFFAMQIYLTTWLAEINIDSHR